MLVKVLSTFSKNECIFLSSNWKKFEGHKINKDGFHSYFPVHSPFIGSLITYSENKPLK